MKKIKYFLYAIFIVLVAISCTSSHIDDNEMINYIRWDSLENTDFLTAPYTSLEFVKLETNNNCILNDIAKIEMVDQLIFIEDYMQRLYLFQRDGKFVCKIGEKGGAENEYITMFDFVLNREKKQVYVIDSSKGVIVIYDYDGNHLGNKRFDPVALSHSVKVAFVDDDCLITINFNSPDEKYNFSLFDLNSGDLVDCIEYLSIGNIRSHNESGRMTTMSSDLLLSAELSDTIYTCINEEIRSKYVFQGPAKHASRKALENERYDFGSQATSKLLNNGFSAGITNLYSTNKILHFHYQTKDEYYRIFYNTETEKGYKFDVMTELDADNTLLWNYLKASAEEAFVCALPVGEFSSKVNVRETYSDLNNLLNISKDEDNPILAFFLVSQ